MTPRSLLGRLSVFRHAGASRATPVVRRRASHKRSNGDGRAADLPDRNRLWASPVVVPYVAEGTLASPARVVQGVRSMASPSRGRPNACAPGGSP